MGSDLATQSWGNFCVAILMFDLRGYPWPFVAIRRCFTRVAIFLGARGYFFYHFVAIRGYLWKK